MTTKVRIDFIFSLISFHLFCKKGAYKLDLNCMKAIFKTRYRKLMKATNSNFENDFVVEPVNR